MNILVLGGSYFLGKHFIDMAKKEHKITVFNRGSRPLMIPDIVEISGERHDGNALLQIPQQHFDAVVDFCAYNKNDIEFIFQNLKATFDQYIFISTCDAYKRGLGTVLDENAPFEEKDFGGEVGAYILGKVALEKELISCATSAGVKYTSIRPAFIYGPDNYAPREGMYFHWIESAGQIIHPTDATGEFQMVYVDDVAEAIFASIGNQAAYNQAFNLTPTPMVTYESFADALEEAVSTPFVKVPITVQMVLQQQIPLPFPLTREESNWYDGTKALQLIEGYTPLAEGLKMC